MPQKHSLNILSSESHLHLYGCLPSKSLWSVAEERSHRYAERFQWFLAEYERATGKRINPNQWWKADDGFENFKAEYVCGHAVSFEVFQAKFNLLIALFPPNPEDMWLANEVFEHHSKEGGYKEYRTFLPLYLPESARETYLRRIAETAAARESATYHPRIAISLMRKDTEAWDGYHFLAKFLEKNPDVAPWITGVDFCASEQGHPPMAKKNLFHQIHHDNQNRQRPIEILYHVGEMWQDISIASAARWCVEAAELKAHRLGHALALGMDVGVLHGRKIRETVAETERHLAWLRLHRATLHGFGFTPTDYQWLRDQAETRAQDDHVEWIYDDDLILHTTKFQNAALAMVRQLGPTVESCPTSNMRIGSLKSPAQHPLRRFLDHGLNVVMSTDDPGVFDISLASEELNVIQNFTSIQRRV